MSKKLKVLSFVLAALMVVAVFASCGKKEEVGGSSAVMTESEIGNENTDKEGDVDADGDKDEDDNNQTANASESTKSKTKSGKKTIKVNATGWPIVNEKETLTIMGIAKPEYTEYSKMDFAKYMEKKTNVQIKYIGLSYGGVGSIQQRKTLAIQSGDLPDIFTLEWDSFSDYEIIKYSSEGTFKNLKDDIKKYAPNIQKALDDPTTAAINTSADGGVYIIPARPVATPNYERHFLNIRKTWLDNLGLDVPKTAQEFLEVMRAFRDEDPNKNGQADEIPFALWNWGAKFIYAWWGILADDKTGIGIDQTGKAYFMHVIDNALPALKYWNSFAYEEKGLMDTTIVGKTEGFWSPFTTQVKTGKVGCFWWSDMSSTYIDPNLLKEYVPMPYPTAGFVNTKYKLCGSAQPFNSYPMRGSTLITKKCASIPMALRYYDYFYSDEGTMVGNYGPVESGLYKKVSGGYQLTSKADASNMAKVAPATGLGIPAIDTLTCKLDSTTAPAKEKPGIEYIAKANKLYAAESKKNKVIFYSDFPKTATEITKLRKFEYFYDKGGWASQFVSGYQNIADYTTFVNDLYQKGIDQYVAIYQKVVDRNKKYLVTV